MAISRAQLLKELLPGLNALFGLEYATYQSKTKALPSLMTMLKKLSQLATTMKPLLSASP